MLLAGVSCKKEAAAGAGNTTTITDTTSHTKTPTHPTSTDTTTSPPPQPPVVVIPKVVINKGVSGNNTVDLLNRIDTAVIPLNPDLVIMMIGTNDVRKPGKTIPFSEYKTNLATLIKKFRVLGIDVLLLSPPPIGTKTLVYPDAVNQQLDSVGYVMKQYSNSYNCMYLDINALIKSAGSPNATALSLLDNTANAKDHPDGIHFTPEGAAFVATSVYNYLRDNNRLNYYKIVCFGDSLTYGLYLTNPGTVNGNNYPSVLYNFFK